ncbi:MAG: coproporphyrinogen III oxidase family protein, partial [Treponema sp.]|nr:coproporphyrinogen III oxidase family protein [Treponema sp.]
MIRGGPPGPFAEYSLYIHVPFCRSFCDYCDFYSVALGSSSPGSFSPGDRDLINRYIAVLEGDARRLLEEFPPASVPSVYIGGGTPSVLGEEGMGRLLALLGDLLPPPAEEREWTMEANPESLDRALLRVCREGGINRLSLGVQSLSPRLRALVHRRGGAERVYRALDLAAEFFPQDFSVDLMAGLPEQRPADLLGDLEEILGFHPAHLSLYSLSLEEGTPLWNRRGELPPEDRRDSLWITGRDALEDAGYGQYEVSNFSLPGKESRHNLRYWAMKNWLALGPSGSGTLIDDRTGTGRRYTWPADMDAWFSPSSRIKDGGTGLAFLPAAEYLDRLTLMKESLLMGFRCVRGPDGELFARRFGLRPEEAVPRSLAKYRDRGLAAPRG